MVPYSASIVLIDKITVRVCQIPPGQLEALAADRLVWRDVCKDGLATFSINYDQEAEPQKAASSPHHLLAADSRPTLSHL